MDGDIAFGLGVVVVLAAVFAWLASRRGEHWVAWLVPPSLLVMFGSAALRWDAGFYAGLAAVTVTGFPSTVWGSR